MSDQNKDDRLPNVSVDKLGQKDDEETKQDLPQIENSKDDIPEEDTKIKDVNTSQEKPLEDTNLLTVNTNLKNNIEIRHQIDPRASEENYGDGDDIQTSEKNDTKLEDSGRKRLNSDPSASPRPKDLNLEAGLEPSAPAGIEPKTTQNFYQRPDGRPRSPATNKRPLNKSRTRASIKRVSDTKEMDWFIFENRVREIVRDILDPYAIKSIDIQESIKMLSDSHDKFKRKQEEMEFLMHKSHHRTGGIDELNKKLFDLENERKVREARNLQQIESLKVQLQTTQDRMTQVEELSLTFKKQADDIKHEINGFFDQLTKFQQKFSGEQLKYKEDMNRNFLTLRNQYLKTEELSKVNKNYITNHFDELKRHDMVLLSFQKNFNELYKKYHSIDKNKIDIAQFNDETTKLKKDISHVRFLNEDVFQSVQLIDNYIEDFIPMKIEKMLKEFNIKMNSNIDNISPIYRYKQLFVKKKPNESDETNEAKKSQDKNSETINEGEGEGDKEEQPKTSSPLPLSDIIKKYKTLTGNLEDQRKELDNMDDEELERISKMVEQEENMELDVDKVLDYVLNLIAYMNEGGERTENPRKMSHKINLDSKDLLKKRFQSAGMTEDVVSSKRYSAASEFSSKRRNSRKIINKAPTSKVKSVIEVPQTKKVINEESKIIEPDSPGRNMFSKNQIEYHKPKSVKMDTRSLPVRKTLKSDEENEYGDNKKVKIEDLDEETAELVLKALDDVKDIKEKIQEEKDIIEDSVIEMKKSIEKEKEILTAKFESKKIYLQKYVENIQKDLEEELIKRNREKSNVNMKLNTIDVKMDKILCTLKEYDDSFESLSDVVA